jgi:hypothetical protein
MSITIQEFGNDPTGKRFTDVIKDQRLAFQEVIDFFNQPAAQLRMRDSEIHHDRPALAGVIKEFESLKSVHDFFASQDAHKTQRTRQAIGVLVLMHMWAMGWKKANRKGSLGRRVRVKAGTTAKGAYYNRTGISHWFTQAERYEPVEMFSSTQARGKVVACGHACDSNSGCPDWELWNKLRLKASRRSEALDAAS